MTLTQHELEEIRKRTWVGAFSGLVKMVEDIIAKRGPSPWSQCTGDDTCPEEWHSHGCFADKGKCNDPLDHLEVQVEDPTPEPVSLDAQTLDDMLTRLIQRDKAALLHTPRRMYAEPRFAAWCEVCSQGYHPPGGDSDGPLRRKVYWPCSTALALDAVDPLTGLRASSPLWSTGRPIEDGQVKPWNPDTHEWLGMER